MKKFITLLVALVSLWQIPLTASTKPLPEFTQSAPEYWLNSQPMKKWQLKGKVVLIEVWTTI